MPFKAMKDIDKTEPIDADETQIDDIGKKFYCPTPGCYAEMSIVHAGDRENAFFRRNPSSPDHINANCVRCNMHFDEQHYSERRFCSEKLFEYVLRKPGEPKHKGTSGTRNGNVGGHTAVKTLAIFYDLVCTKGIDYIYNGIRIGTLFANENNYDFYKESNLVGDHIVETSFCGKIYNENKLVFNYPCDWTKDHILIQIIFPSSDEAFSAYNLYHKYSHTAPIVLAGNWRLSHDIFHAKESLKSISYECNFISTRQLYIPN